MKSNLLFNIKIVKIVALALGIASLSYPEINLSASTDTKVKTTGILFVNPYGSVAAVLIQDTSAVLLLNCTPSEAENRQLPTEDGKATEDFISAHCQPLDLTSPGPGAYRVFSKTVYQSAGRRFVIASGGMGLGRFPSNISNPPSDGGSDVSQNLPWVPGLITFLSTLTLNLDDLSNFETIMTSISHLGNEDPRSDTSRTLFERKTEATFQYPEISDAALQQ